MDYTVEDPVTGLERPFIIANEPTQSSDDELEPGTGFYYDGDTKIIYGGCTGRVELLESGYARKCPYPDSPDRDGCLQDIASEYRIYKILGSHPRLLRVIYFDPHVGLTMEYVPNGNLKRYLRKNEATITDEQRRQWVQDALESVDLLHTHDVIHSDLKAENFLVDAQLRLRITDFSGSSTPDRVGTAVESARHFLPRKWEDPPTIATDLFALGSTIYEIVTGVQPYAALHDEEVERLYAQKKFPATDHLMFHSLMQACWNISIDSANDLKTMFDVSIQ
ncbi:kinase-like domain-containing protein [Elsinoe ampelina]|uniref:Kinase-like domain-containing protein n=1 Tax=Elsinoe ampelina TaxID=302913 RepID=A0A6A6GMH0_9PEZI|nr:kinase-like domain-containing protein [Elsinoe ampelina]